MVKAMVGFLLMLVLAAWFILKPGVFFMPPSAFDTEGYTLIYYEKTSGMPFFSSPETLCMAQYGEITPMCLETGHDTASYLSQRMITYLPYADWAYQLFLPQR